MKIHSESRRFSESATMDSLRFPIFAQNRSDMKRLTSAFFEFLSLAAWTGRPELESLSFSEFCRSRRVPPSSMNELLLRKLDVSGEESVMSFKKFSLALGEDGSIFKKLTKN